MLMVVKAFYACTLMLGASSDFGFFKLAAVLCLGLCAVLFAASDIVLATDFFSGGKDIKKENRQYDSLLQRSDAACLIAYVDKLQIKYKQLLKYKFIDKKITLW